MLTQVYNSVVNTLPNFPRAVPVNEWYAQVKGFFEKSDGYIMVETSPEDMAKIEQLLQVEKWFFSTPYVVKTKLEFCPNCNRRNNFLDVVGTGLKVHTPQFLVNVFTGKYGHIINDSTHQRCICFECGKDLPEDATKFSAPKEPSEETKNCSGYTFPFYTYRF